MVRQSMDTCIRRDPAMGGGGPLISGRDLLRRTSVRFSILKSGLRHARWLEVSPAASPLFLCLGRGLVMRFAISVDRG
jgi:hypothetical protein